MKSGQLISVIIYHFFIFPQLLQNVISINTTLLLQLPPVFSTCNRKSCDKFDQNCEKIEFTCPCKCGTYMNRGCDPVPFEETTNVLVGIEIPILLKTWNSTFERSQRWQGFSRFFNGIFGGPICWIGYYSKSGYVQGFEYTIFHTFL